MMGKHCLLDYAVCAAIAFACMSASSSLEAAVIPWTSTEYSMTGDSIVGRSHTAYDKGIPGVFRSIESRHQDSDSDAVLPVPGPGNADTLSTHVDIQVGMNDERRAGTQSNWTGSPLTAISTTNSVGSIAKNLNFTNQTIKTEGTGVTKFVGQFVSTGALLELNYDGSYSLLAFHQNGALMYSPQLAESSLSVVLNVQDLTASNVLISQTLFSDTLTRNFFGVVRKDEEPIEGTSPIPLAGTSGHTIQVTLTMTARATSYAYRSSSDPLQYGPAGATANAAFNEFNFSITPEPAALGLLTMGGLMLWRKIRQ